MYSETPNSLTGSQSLSSIASIKTRFNIRIAPVMINKEHCALSNPETHFHNYTPPFMSLSREPTMYGWVLESEH